VLDLEGKGREEEKPLEKGGQKKWVKKKEKLFSLKRSRMRLGRRRKKREVRLSLSHL